MAFAQLSVHQNDRQSMTNLAKWPSEKLQIYQNDTQPFANLAK
jgi:hypothetical protein